MRSDSRTGMKHMDVAAILSALLLGLAACGTTTSGTSAPASASPSSKPSVSAGSSQPSGSAQAAAGDSQAQWNQLVAAAKQEGKLELVTAPGDVYRAAFDEFQKTFGINVESIVGNGPSDVVPRIVTERQASQFLWDVFVHTPVGVFQGFKPAGAVDPIRPALILPEVLDDSKWLHGFDAGWADNDKAYSYAFVTNVLWTTYINRDVVPESQLNKLDQLWDPKWKGKIAMQDPRQPSSGSGAISVWYVAKGEEKLRSILRDQQPTVTADRRQLGEWLIRGQYPIAVGFVPEVMQGFIDQGVNVSQVKPLDDGDPAGQKISLGAGSVALFNRPPHPNAAKLFVNWMLSRDGLTKYSQATTYNVRRLDVPVANPKAAADPNKEYVDLDRELNYSKQLSAIAIAKELIK